jgi:hypothetical protein
MGGFRRTHTADYTGGLVFYVGSQTPGFIEAAPSSDSQATASLTEAMRINFNGNVGIGTTNADNRARVFVWGSGGQAFNLVARFYNQFGQNGTIETGRFLSIYVTDQIACQELQVFSDRRIKNDIIDVNDSSALDKLRLLKPKKYRYRDTINRGIEQVYGFIAQEVQEVIPYSTSTTTNHIPNIYELAEVSDSNVITFTTFNTSDLESNATTIQIMDTVNNPHDATIVEVIDEHTIRVAENLDEWSGSVDDEGVVDKEGTQIFVYGQNVNDFLTLNKNAIWTVATAALQEVDRQLQAEKVKVVSLETQVANLLERVTALESI